jgi:hypothetical protein
MQASPVNGSYSADVRIRLESGDSAYRVAQVGPAMLIMGDQCRLPPCDARLVISVDGVEDAYDIYLCDGVSPEQQIVRFI